MYYQILDNYDPFSSCANIIITHIGTFLTLKEQIQVAASSKKIKANVFCGTFNVTFPIQNLINFKQFLSSNSNLKSLNLHIEINSTKENSTKEKSSEEKLPSSGLLTLQEFFPKITNLDLKCTYPEFHWFSSLTNLKNLSIGNCKANLFSSDNFPVVDQLNNFPRISQLTLYNYKNIFYTDGLRILPLEQLTLNACKYIELDRLTDFVHLKQLSIKDCESKSVVIPSFRGCYSLQSITLEGIIPSKLEPLSELKELKEFYLETGPKTKRQKINLDFLQNCKTLTSLTLIRVNITDVSIFNTCPCLKKVWLLKTINLVDISPLTQLPDIREIRVISTSLDISNVVTFPSTLIRLELSGKIMDGNINFTSKMKEIRFKFNEYKNGLSC
jgi:hypothetical protein